MINLQNLSTFYIQGLREAPTITKLIVPLLREAGINNDDINSTEEEFNVQTSFGAVAIDICIKIKGRPWIFLQAKPIGKAYLFRVDYKKTFEAAFKQRIPYVIFTDGNSWEFYKKTLQSGLDPQYNLLWRIDLVHKPQKTLEITHFLQGLLAEGEIANG